MPLIVHGFLFAGSLLWASSHVAVQKPEVRPSQKQEASVQLASEHPEASFAVPPDTLATSPAVLDLKVTRVVNPAKTAFQVFVSLSYRPAEASGSAPATILLGNGILYPSDEPGGFRMRASGAFAKLKAAKATDVRLVLEMKRIHPNEPWSQVEITVAPPQWRTENADSR